MKGTHAKTSDANNNMMGFGGFGDDEDVQDAPAGRGRGGRGGRGGMRQRNSIVEQGRNR